MRFSTPTRALLSVVTACAAAPLAAQPTLEPLENISIFSGSPVHVPLNGFDPAGGPLVFTAESSDIELVTPEMIVGNRSLVLTITGLGDMVFELFEARTPRATSRIIELVESGFYDGLTFHRVIDRFVIQGGDPRGDSTGGSGVNWDDQFHVDLQHNRRGVLSMAKSFDDTNDSQFFVTALAVRNLDFNHTIFGQLVAGEEVRDAISNTETDAADKPLTPVVIERAQIIEDTQNGLLFLKPPTGANGSVEITVTVVDTAGVTARQSFIVNIAPDNINSPPFLADIPVLTTTTDTEFTYQLEAIDVEGDPALFLDDESMEFNGLPVPIQAPADLVYEVEFETGLLRVSPRNGLSGTHFLSVATGIHQDFIDYQVVTVHIEP